MAAYFLALNKYFSYTDHRITSLCEKENKHSPLEFDYLSGIDLFFLKLKGKAANIVFDFIYLFIIYLLFLLAISTFPYWRYWLFPCEAFPLQSPPFPQTHVLVLHKICSFFRIPHVCLLVCKTSCDVVISRFQFLVSSTATIARASW